jgi:hypothetical protein
VIWPREIEKPGPMSSQFVWLTTGCRNNDTLAADKARRLNLLVIHSAVEFSRNVHASRDLRFPIASSPFEMTMEGRVH